MKRKPIFSLILGVCLWGGVLGCAGPTTPFGAIHTWTSPLFVPKSPERKLASTNKLSDPPKIQFYPVRQNLHSRAPFKVEVVDPDGIQPAYEIQVVYNGIDITKNLLRQSQLEEQENKIHLTFPNLRLKAHRENHIEFFYRSKDQQSASAEYLPPYCSAFDDNPILTTTPFDAPEKYLKLIAKYSKQTKINPSYITGLIAQESGFNPKSVSWAKAIGLTQITPLAEKEILRLNRSYKYWPRYPRINRLSSTKIKSMIAQRKISSVNEWRLNPEYSIKGGLSYLIYLNNYWRIPKNLRRIARLQGNTKLLWSQVILASYNSGPSRVKYAIDQYGEKWLHAPKLEEARKYVNKIFSYCFHFSENSEEKNAEKT